MTCTDIASGTRVSLTYVEEESCGVTPSTLGTPVDDGGLGLASDTATPGTGLLDFVRTTGSWIDEDFVPEQIIVIEGFTAPVLNANWRVAAVTALRLTVYDDGDVGVTEAAGAGRQGTLTMSTLRATGRELNLTIDTLESEEVRPSRQFADVRHGFNQVTGSPGFELSNISYSDFIRAAMSGEWESPTYTGGVFTITLDTPSVGLATIGRTSNNWVDDGFRPGEMIQFQGFANAANNGVFRVMSISGQDLVIDTSFAVGYTGVVDGTLNYPGARIDSGLFLRTFTMERRFDDIIQYQADRGCTVNEMSLSVSPESIAGGSWGILGMSGTELTPTSLIGALLPIAAPTTSPFAAFDGRVYEGGELQAVMTSMELNLNNNRTLEGVIGSKFSPGVFEGRQSVEGTFTFFLQGNTTYNKFVNETESSVWMRLADPNDPTHFFNIIMPRVKYTTGDSDPPQEGPVPLNMGFRSLEVDVPDAAGNGNLIPTSLTIQVNPLR